RRHPDRSSSARRRVRRRLRDPDHLRATIDDHAHRRVLSAGALGEGGAGDYRRHGINKKDAAVARRPSEQTESTLPLIPAEAGIQFLPGNQSLLAWLWIPAFAGMSGEKRVASLRRRHDPDVRLRLLPAIRPDL